MTHRIMSHRILALIGGARAEDVKVYEELFEGRFLRETEEFYAAEGIRYMETADVPHFLQHVEDRLQQVGFLAFPLLSCLH